MIPDRNVSIDIPTTVTAALADRPVAGAVCLEAGAGVGNATAGLLAAGGTHVYAVTNDREDARTVRERVDASPARLSVLLADLRATPLSNDSVDVITAHGLFNLLAPAAAAAVARELARVAAPGCHLVVDDYAPLPDGAAVSSLFALESAIGQMVEGRPGLTFYPAATLRELFVGQGWEFDREQTLLDPVPWTASHLDAHAEVARSTAAGLPDGLCGPLRAEIDHRRAAVEEERVGTMYSLAFRFARNTPHSGTQRR